MVTQKTMERYMNEAIEIAKEAETAPEVAERVIKVLGNRIARNRRQPKPPPPKGGITLMDASRKYNIPPATLSDWLRYGWVELIKQAGKFKFLKESDIIRLASVERGAGYSTLSKVSNNGG